MPATPTIDVELEIARFLATSRTAALATVGPDGRPHAANIQYAQDGRLRLYWVSSPSSLHSRHIAERCDVALAVYAHDDRPQHIHGCQFRGVATEVTDEAEANDAFDLYTTKFAFTAALPQFREIVERQSFYRFTPTWIRWIDNRRGFGFKAEKDLQQ